MRESKLRIYMPPLHDSASIFSSWEGREQSLLPLWARSLCILFLLPACSHVLFCSVWSSRANGSLRVGSASLSHWRPAYYGRLRRFGLVLLSCFPLRGKLRRWLYGDSGVPRHLFRETAGFVVIMECRVISYVKGPSCFPPQPVGRF